MAAPPSRPIADRLLDARIITLFDEVTDDAADSLVARLLALSADDPYSDICLFVNSPGGSVLAGLAVYDVMQLIPNDVVTVAAGLAASMGQVLLCAGAPGKRFALPNAQILMHEGSAGIGGSASDVAIQADNLVATLDRMRSIIARHTGRTVEQVERDVGRDRWFGAQEAKEYGFVDHIVGSLDEVLPQRVARRVGLAGDGRCCVSSYTIPTVIEATARGERITDIYSRLLADRIVFIGTPIDDGVANVVVAQLLHLASVNPKQDIQLYINSPGGSFTAMMAIYDTMRFVAPDVATLCVGQAASSSAILLAAGASGKRAVLEHARVLLHQPHTGGTRGSISDLALEAAELERIRREADTVLASHTGHSVERIRDDTDRALVLSGLDAVAYGIADVVPEPMDLRGAELEARSPLRARVDS